MAPSALVTRLRTVVPRSKTARSTAADGSMSDGSLVELSLERLRGLQRILPECDDVEVLKTYDGDVARLGTAEKFYLELMQLPQ